MRNLFVRDDSVPSRLAISEMLNRKGLTGIGVELGVWRGDFSYPFLRRWSGFMHLVDPWQKLNDYDDIRNEDFDPKDFTFVEKRFKPYRKRIKIHRCLSMEAAKEIPDNLDFVYVDANHAYDYVLHDLNTYWSKIKPGGILAGHDIFFMLHPEVTAAVTRFALDKDLTVYLVDADYDEHGKICNAHSYYMEKPI